MTDMKFLDTLKEVLLEREFPLNIVQGILETVHTIDAVPVIRCQDCKRWEPHCNGKAGICEKRKGVAKANDFCSYGERR